MKNKTNKEKHMNKKFLSSYAFGLCIDSFEADQEAMNISDISEFTFHKKKSFSWIRNSGKNSAKTTINHLGQEEDAVYIVYK